jgi:hypothetical protein
MHFGRYSNLQYFHSSTITHTSGQNALMFGPSTIEVDMPNLLSVEIDFYDARNIEKLNLPKLRHLGPYNFYKLRNKEYALPSLEEIVSYNFEQLYDTTLYLRSLKVIATGNFGWLGASNSHIYLGATPPQIEGYNRTFNSGITIHVPKGSLKKYQEDPTWILCQSVRGFTLVEEEE